MRRIKKAAGLVMLLSVGLCLISVPASAEHGWEEDPPQFGKDDYSGAPGPRKVSEDAILSNRGLASSLPFIFDVSYRLIELSGFGDELIGGEQGLFEPLEAPKSEAQVNQD